LALNRDVEDWFEAALKIPGTALADLDWRVLVKSVTLPGEPPNDPADRILISTARRQLLCLITRDREILEYARAGHVDALAC
jgi:PIN domain nuclease of toxin-antitoxin system